MTDIHCHILPGADDGAETMEDAVQMARMAAASGVRTILATPHCNLPFAEQKNYISTGLRDQFVALARAVKQALIPLAILPGAEVFCTPQVPELLDRRLLLGLAGSRYLLVEFFFDESPDFMNDMLRAIAGRGMIPVVAHPERYDAIQASTQLAQEWVRLGYVLQINKGSILGRLGRGAELAADRLLSDGLAHIAASDAHSPLTRTPELDELRRYLEQAYSPRYARLLLEQNPQRILSDLPVLPYGHAAL